MALSTVIKEEGHDKLCICIKILGLTQVEDTAQLKNPIMHKKKLVGVGVQIEPPSHRW